jgi:hypothetical protein
MKNIHRSISFELDQPVKISYEDHGETKRFEVTGAKVTSYENREDKVQLIGFELLKSGKRRTNAYARDIYPYETVYTLVDKEYVPTTTAVKAVYAFAREVGIQELYKPFSVEVS